MTGSKDRILDAAEQIVVRDGVGHLTIDAVAAEAKLSKGGVLYHFPSKEGLILGMIARMTEQFEGRVSRFESADPYPEGRKVRAMLRASFPNEEDRVAAGLVAAVVNNPELLRPVQERSRKFHDMVWNESKDPELAMLIHMAADGIWMSSFFGTGVENDKGMKARLVARLIEMTKSV